jgi:myxalamid-type polyketide synthase MxaE and MxaD
LHIDTQGCYLITGGFSDIGQSLMNHLIGAGARYVILMGRSQPSDALLAQVAHFKASGVHLRLYQGDVAVAEDVASLMRLIQRSGNPLKGIYHLAAVIQDSVLAKLEPAELQSVLEPKVSGTWNLHRETQEISLDWFIAFSSISASIGLAGQSAYVAANAFIESLMRYRHSCGLPGTAIGWGPWSGGMTARLAPAHRDRLMHMGLNLFETEQVVTIALNANVTSYPMLIAADISLPALHALSRPGFTIKSQAEAISNGLEIDTPVGEAQKRDAMAQLLIEELALVVNHRTLTLDIELSELGLDSLTAVAVVQRVRQRTGKTLPISAFFDSPRLRDVVEKLLKHC